MAKPKRMSVARRDLANREHVLYRFWDANDVLLYVGITVDSPSRFASHMRDQPWWGEVETIRVTKYPNRKAALEAEAEMIRTLKPLYNVVHNEMVDVSQEAEDDEVDWRRELEIAILSEFDDDERDFFFERNRDNFGEGTDRAELQTWSALDGVAKLHRERRQFVGLVMELQALLPEERQIPIERIRDDLLRGSNPVFDADVAMVSFVEYIATIATEYLARMDPEAAEGWRLRAMELESPAPSQVDRVAARHACWWLGGESFHRLGCRRTMRHGALCHRKIGARVWYEICPWCAADNKACEGHLFWCLEHMREAESAGLGILQDTGFGAFPIARSEIIHPDNLFDALHGRAAF